MFALSRKLVTCLFLGMGLGVYAYAAPRVAVVSSLDRVLQDVADIEGKDRAQVFCARGETESFQVVVMNNDTEPIRRVNPQMGTWIYTGSRPYGQFKVSVFREHYVRVSRPSYRSRERAGRYPDALIPFVDPYTGQTPPQSRYMAADATIEPGMSQAYWVDVTVPRDMAPGDYSNVIRILVDGQTVDEVPVEVTVWDFDLPQQRQLSTWFEDDFDGVDGYHSARTEQQRKAIKYRYYEMLSEHGIVPVLRSAVQRFDGTGRAVFDGDAVREMKEFAGRFKTRYLFIPPFYRRDPEKCVNYLRSYSEFLQRETWAGQGVVPLDEPSTISDYEEVREYGRLINEAAPNIQLLVTEQITPESARHPSLNGFVDIWVPSWSLADPEKIRQRQQAGDEVWSYNALYHPGVPNWLLDSPLLDYRAPAWFSWSLDLRGLLYWRVAAWAADNRRIDPWLSPETYTKNGRHWNGEGSLLYPGNAVGVVGPVASMRLKVLRDAMEDYDFFHLVRQSGQKQQMDALTSGVASSFRDYSKDPAEYEQARRQAAQLVMGVHLE